MQACRHMDVYTHTRTHARMHSQTHTHARMHAQTHTCAHARMHTHTHTHTCTRTHARTHTRTHTVLDLFPNVLCPPFRPTWDASTSAEKLDLMERESFLAWRRSLALWVDEAAWLQSLSGVWYSTPSGFMMSLWLREEPIELKTIRQHLACGILMCYRLQRRQLPPWTLCYPLPCGWGPRRCLVSGSQSKGVATGATAVNTLQRHVIPYQCCQATLCA